MSSEVTLYPSGAHRWTACPGSPAASQAHPGQQSEAAKEGECAAWVAEVVLHGDAHSCEDMLGETHKNGVTVDQEMVDHTQTYVGIVRSVAGNNLVSVEHVIEMGPIRGRLDAAATTMGDAEIHVFDLKYGRSPVEVFENKTMLTYGSSLVTDATTMVHLHIVQPRGIHAGGIHRTWSVPIALMMDWYRWIMYRARLAAGQEPNDPDHSMLIPGDHCLHCNAATNCTALAGSVYRYVEVATSNVARSTEPGEISEELAFLTTAKKLLAARLSAVEAEVTGRIETGVYVPGWGMEDKVGKRAWNATEAVIRMSTGINPTVDKLCTPAELERRGANKAVVKTLTYTPRIGRKLVPVEKKTFMQMFGKGSG